jgi:hypothetical protein
MISRTRIFFLSTTVLLMSGGALLLCTSGSTTHAGAAPIAVKESAEKNPPATRPVADKPLPGFQRDLLDMAFSTASRVPAAPHIKTRSRMQEEVAETCFELDQPRRGLECVEKIEDWRRGKGYADFAFYCAERGDTSEVQHYLDLARLIAQRIAKEPDTQEWQIDRIRASIAKTYVVLGATNKADELTAGAVEFEAGKVEALKVSRMDAKAFDAELLVIDGMIEHGNFDKTKNALESCAKLFDRFYDDQERRTLVADKIRSSWSKLPLGVRIDLLVELVESALKHDDRSQALALVDEALALMESATWLPEDHVALMARLAGLRGRAGDEAGAKSEAGTALALFRSEREKIANFRRAGALRPLAEAYQSLNDGAAALSIYKTAVEEGSVNPNARARAEDLAATCRSMALSAVQPDAELTARMRQIHDGLVDPW